MHQSNGSVMGAPNRSPEFNFVFLLVSFETLILALKGTKCIMETE